MDHAYPQVVLSLSLFPLGEVTRGVRLQPEEGRPRTTRRREKVKKGTSAGEGRRKGEKRRGRHFSPFLPLNVYDISFRRRRKSKREVRREAATGRRGANEDAEEGKGKEGSERGVRQKEGGEAERAQAKLLSLLPLPSFNANVYGLSFWRRRACEGEEDEKEA